MPGRPVLNGLTACLRDLWPQYTRIDTELAINSICHNNLWSLLPININYIIYSQRRRRLTTQRGWRRGGEERYMVSIDSLQCQCSGRLLLLLLLLDSRVLAMCMLTAITYATTERDFRLQRRRTTSKGDRKGICLKFREHRHDTVCLPVWAEWLGWRYCERAVQLCK